MSDIEITCKPVGKSKTRTKVAVSVDGKPLHVDVFNIESDTRREAFVEKLIERCPSLGESESREKLEALLLDRAAESIAQETPTDDGSTRQELDVSSIARPELIHHHEFSAVTVPYAFKDEDGPRGGWHLYIRWHADGRRERRTLAKSIELLDGRKLWFNPMPSDPLPTTRAAWSASSRKAWLDGEETPNPADLFNDLCEAITKYIHFSGDDAKGDCLTLALWVMLSYAYPAWSAVPYLFANGTRESGKTRMFEVLNRLVFRPIQSSNMSAACLYRTLHDAGGTLLLDEAEQLRSRTPGAEDLRSILLSGYKAGSPARRLEPLGDGRFKSISFDCFGPKAMAAISRLPDALASRCIPMRMLRCPVDAPQPRRRIDEDPAIWARLRNVLHATALEYGLEWLRLADTQEVCPAMTGRQYELWQPLLAIASFIESNGVDGLLKFMQSHALRSCENSNEDVNSDADELLLKIIVGAVQNGAQGDLTPSDVLRRAKELDPETFTRWAPRSVSAALGRYGIRTTKSGNSRTFRSVTLRNLQDVEARYGLPLGLSVCVPCVPTVPGMALAV